MRGVKILFLACAAFSGLLAMWFMRSAIESRANVPAQVVQAPVQPKEEAPQFAEILVAAKDMTIGKTVVPEDVRWQKWPAESTSPYFYVKAEDPDAATNVEGATARVALRAGEPLTTEKIIGLDGSGVMATLLRQGMRAISVPISDITGAGGFILPGDFVDLLLTRQINIEDVNPEDGTVRGTETHNVTELVMETVRVLAIDQRLSETEGSSALGNTATLEVTAEQAELLTVTRQIAKQERGFLTLSLRNFGDLVKEFGEDLSVVKPKTVLDLQALAKAKIEKARMLQERSLEFRREQAKVAEMARLRAAESERMRLELAAEALEAEKQRLAKASEPEEKKEDSGVVLVRNGAPIVVNTIEGSQQEGAQK